ncbi:MAG TPA: alpha-ketoglutarate-dependent dioxygenase AlkB [Acidimicrobiales bacterium]|nr:alpha-ketoglutarate-dependent dioxygenase AlkB [Acidimicrobiales bacterium]
MADVLWQPSLLDSGGEPHVDRSFTGLVHHDLDETAWIEHVPGWVSHPGVLFEQLLTGVTWRHHTRRMYDSVVDQPRLDASWKRSSGEPILPVIAEALQALTERYDRPFTTGGLNLYRDGRDSVAWHGDRIPADVVDPVVGIVSLGQPRTFRLRPKGGGRSIAFVPGPGDLLVTGGSCQRTWEHSVPKTSKQVGPRISVTFRHTAY